MTHQQKLYGIWDMGYEEARAGREYLNPYASNSPEAGTFERGYLAGRVAFGLMK